MSMVNEEYVMRMFTRLRDEVLPMTAGSEPLVEYTVVINQENSNCNTACTYADDAAAMSKGSLAWDIKPIFKDIKPCVFYSGAVVYYLNPNDWTKKIDGTAADLTGAEGDVMIEFPKFAYRIYTNTDNRLYVSVTNDPAKVIADNRYSYDAFSRAIIGDLNHFYIGAFPGYVDSRQKLRSIAGVRPTVSKTIAAFNTYAQKNGAHYQQFRYPQLKALQCLYLIKYGNRNGQEALGYGVVNTSDTHTCGYETTATSSLSSYKDTFAKGMCFGDKTKQTKHMRFLGIEDFWGNISQWIKGLKTNGNRAIIYSWSEDNGENVEAEPIEIATAPTLNFSTQYPKYIQGTTEAGFMPRTTNNGSSSTYWPDGIGLSSSGILKFGGNCADKWYAGPFYVSTSAVSYTNNKIGARLLFL